MEQDSEASLGHTFPSAISSGPVFLAAECSRSRISSPFNRPYRNRHSRSVHGSQEIKGQNPARQSELVCSLPSLRAGANPSIYCGIGGRGFRSVAF